MKRKSALVLVLGLTGGVFLVGKHLYSYEVDSAAVKGLVHAVMNHMAQDLEVPATINTKAKDVAGRAIDTAFPVLKGMYKAMGELEGAQGSGPRKAALDRLAAGVTALIEVKDRTVADVAEKLSPRERATVIVKVAARFHDRIGLTPEEIDEVATTHRHLRQARIRSTLKLEKGEAKALFSKMDPVFDAHQSLRHRRIELVQKIEAAVESKADDATLATHLAQWDKLAAEGSKLAADALTRARSALNPDQQAALVLAHKSRLDRALGILNLIAKFVPVRG